jgi:GT2 family glycosyltransferase
VEPRQASGQPTVGLIVLNWNGWSDTQRCLSSLARVPHPNLRVVVVDNGSTDDSVAQIKLHFPEVDLIETGSNLGYAGGNNAGLRWSLEQGFDIVGVLNNDTVVDPAFLEPIVEELERRPNGFVSPRIVYLDHPERAWFAAAEIHPHLGIVVHRDEDLLSLVEADTTIRDEIAVTGCCFLAESEVWRQVGLFDERYFLIFEDSDWCARATALGFQGRVVTNTRIAHAVSSSIEAAPPGLADYYYARNALLYLRSHRPGWQRSALRLLYHFASDFYRGLRYRSQPKGRARERFIWQLKGIIDAMRGRYGKREFE